MSSQLLTKREKRFLALFCSIIKRRRHKADQFKLAAIKALFKDIQTIDKCGPFVSRTALVIVRPFLERIWAFGLYLFSYKDSLSESEDSDNVVRADGMDLRKHLGDVTVLSTSGMVECRSITLRSLLWPILLLEGPTVYWFSCECCSTDGTGRAVNSELLPERWHGGEILSVFLEVQFWEHFKDGNWC